jgi:hypothetical protein
MRTDDIYRFAHVRDFPARAICRIARVQSNIFTFSM